LVIDDVLDTFIDRLFQGKERKGMLLSVSIQVNRKSEREYKRFAKSLAVEFDPRVQRTLGSSLWGYLGR
jgi:uncharacterized membrane-anchored protein YjiN (DUF445 family)